MSDTQISLAYRSSFPERAAAAYRAAEQSRKDAMSAVVDFTNGLFGSEDFTADGFFAFDGSITFRGFQPDQGSAAAVVDLPTGLRYDAKAKMLVPALRTEEGKALSKQMKGLDFTYPYIEGLGGIVTISSDPADVERYERRCYFSGWRFSCFERSDGSTEFYAGLSQPYLDDTSVEKVLAEGSEATGGEVAWERVPLSVFYAASEDHESLAKTG